MKSLREIAGSVETVTLSLPSGRTAHVEALIVRFPSADPSRLPDGVLSRTYTSKPLVEVDGEGVFGEIAIVRYLRRDGWTAVWADTFHGRKFWAEMPDQSSPVSLPPRVKSLYDRIAETKGSPNGCFDVIGWRGDRVVWLEYKGPSDRPNRNEELWIDAALSCGVREEDLIIVGAAARR